MIFVHLKKNKMASEQIAALTKTLTESLVSQQKAQIDFQKQMLVQQERFEALVIQQVTDYFVKLFCHKKLMIMRLDFFRQRE